MLIPGCIYIIINNYIPMGGLLIAFKKINYRVGIWNSPWVGFENFEFLFKTNVAWTITRNTILYNMAFILIGTIFAVGVAMLLNQIRSNSARKTYQTAILLPNLISIVVVSYLVYAFLSSDAGFINNSILKPLKMKPISWYAASAYWPYILVIVSVWKSFGYSCIIYYATIVGIDRSYYEAAVIDGANRWKQMLHITLPGLKSVIVILTLLSISRIFYSDFGLFYQVPLNSGALIDVTNTIDTYVFRGLVQLNNVGMASAAGFYQSIVGFFLVLIANFAVKKIDEDSALF
ncbi:putative aldouronate transport system permease protein [Paenibacillus sp. CF384]|nr:ABC transporter permease subunit [Paenibacillus sp. CF384]SDW47940.1 putative aldouronate transport system permease protein [Paenibacillus sp. CF384]